MIGEVDQDHLLNLIHREIERHMLGTTHEIRGTISSYDPEVHAAKVLLQPGGQETGWISIHALYAGNGWGVMTGPNVKDQVTIQYQGGDLESGGITSRLHSDEDKPPEVQSGEILAKHEKGHKLYFDKDGNVTLYHAAVGGNVTFDKDGNLTADAKSKNLTVNSDTQVLITSSTLIHLKAPSVLIDNGGTPQTLKFCAAGCTAVLKAE